MGSVCLENIDEGYGYKEKEDVYITYVYEVGNNGTDKFLYYINGKLYGDVDYNHSAYNLGRGAWDKDDCHFFLGVCPIGKANNLFYLRGKVYSTRLYTKPLSSTDVKLNYDVTLKSRNGK